MNKNILEKIKIAPKQPGCYVYKDKNKKIIYVGKAKNIFNRVNQYFKNNVDYKTSKLVSEIDDVDFFIVNNENEALILENNLIKKYKPKYNILLKYSSGYPYFVLTNEQHPRLIYTRFPDKFKGKVFGPFATKSFHTKEFIELINSIFPLRKCRNMQKTKCLYYDLGQCLGPCINKIQQSDYDSIISKIKKFFSGNTKIIIDDLKKKLKTYEQELNFEEANKIYELITVIDNLKQLQNVEIFSSYKTDFIAWEINKDNIAFCIFKYENGKLISKFQSLEKKYSNDDQQILQNLIIQYYSNQCILPKYIYIDIENKYIKSLEKIIKSNIICPKIGEKKQILDQAQLNCKYYLENILKNEEMNLQEYKKAIQELKSKLKVKKLNSIIMFDIANLFSEYRVAGMIYFEDGKFIKNKYRLFNLDSSIKSDVDSMKVAIARYIDKNNDSLPDLLIVDGNNNQVNAAKSVCDIYCKKKIKIIGLAKDNKHKTKVICYNNKQENLDRSTKMYKLLSTIQDNVHNFTINNFKKKHLKSLYKK